MDSPKIILSMCASCQQIQWNSKRHHHGLVGNPGQSQYILILPLTNEFHQHIMYFAFFVLHKVLILPLNLTVRCYQINFISHWCSPWLGQVIDNANTILYSLENYFLPSPWKSPLYPIWYYVKAPLPKVAFKDTWYTCPWPTRQGLDCPPVVVIVGEYIDI